MSLYYLEVKRFLYICALIEILAKLIIFSLGKRILLIINEVNLS